MTANERFTEELARVLHEIVELVDPQTRPEYRRHLVWKRESSTQWRGSWEEKSTPPQCLKELDWRGFGAQLEQSFRARYADLPAMVGTSLTGWLRFSADRLLQSAVHELWNRHPDWAVGEDRLREFVKELDECLKAKELTFTFLAPLVNFDMDDGLDRIDLNDNTALIRMTPEQISGIYGGPDLLVEGRGRTSPVPCALAGRFTEPVSRADDGVESHFHSRVQPMLDRLVLGLQTYAPAAVALDGVHIACAAYSPFVIAQPSLFKGDAFVPSGSYCLKACEGESLKEHLAMFAQELHPVLEIACSRYGSAAVRRKAHDRLLDSIIGLEAVLLKDTGDANYRGELRYRLAVRYATLFNSASERMVAFRTMKGLYDARSKLVHGSDMGKPLKIGDAELSANEVANKAQEVLREVLLTFLPDGRKPRFTKEGFWEDQLFGEG